MSEDIVERRMSAYYYEFTATGVDAIDKVLSAVACAGKAFHHTEQWTEEAGAAYDHTGETPVEWIQNAALEAADEARQLRESNAFWQRAHNKAWDAIPDCFKLSPTDGGGIDADLAIADMAKEIERLRAHNAALLALNDGFDKANRQHVTNLSEAIRLMEPVAEYSDIGWKWDRMPLKIGMNISDFVKRMKGE